MGTEVQEEEKEAASFVANDQNIEEDLHRAM